jgi:hypothetical protein
MASLVRTNFIEGSFTLPQQYGGTELGPGQSVIIADTPANVSSALLAIAPGILTSSVTVSLCPDNQTGAIQPTSGAALATYSPAVPGNWPTPPTTVAGALDSIAAGDTQPEEGVVKHARLVTAAALATYTRTGSVITASGNGALTVDGIAVAAGNRILLTLGAAAADNGIYVVTAPGTSGTPFVLTYAQDWITGTVVSGTRVVAGSEGTTWPCSEWVVDSAPPITVGTTGLSIVPRRQKGTSAALSGSGTATISNVWLASTTLSKVLLTPNTPGGTAGILSAASAGRTAISGAGGNGAFVITSSSATDTSTVDWEIVNF